jgi:serine protease Do
MKNMESTEESKPQATLQEGAGEGASEDMAKKTQADTQPNDKAGNRYRNMDYQNGYRRRSFLPRLGFFILFFILNALFVVVAVEALFHYRYSDGQIQSVQPVQVVQEESQVIDVAKNSSPAVVSIIATAQVPQYETQYEQFFNFQVPSRVQSGTVEQQIGAGTGFLVSADGYIITNKHVVEDANATYTVILNDENHKNEKDAARIVAIDPNPNRDIAILKIEKTGLPYLNLGNSDDLKVGQTAVAIGYALGEFDNTVSRGVISGLHRSITASGTSNGAETLKNLIQTDASLNSGNSGGPLLDISGNVIGVNVAMADAQSIGFAIPINDVKADYDQAKASGSIKKEAQAFLGVRYMAIDASVKKQDNLAYDYGAIITRGQTMSDLAITPGSPADKAGLAENDIILEVDGVRVDESNTLPDLLAQHKPGDQIKLKISHKGEEKEVTVTLGTSS